MSALPGNLSPGGRLSVVQDVVAAARQNTPELGQRLATLFNLLGRDELVAVWGRDVLFAIASQVPVELSVDGGASEPMMPVAGRPYWVLLKVLGIGRTYAYRFYSNGEACGGGDVSGYNADSYDQPDGYPGTLSERRTVVSSVYPGATTEFWMYANPGVQVGRPSPVMVWHDGEGLIGVADLFRHRLQVVADNLANQGRIPAMVHVLISPSTGGEAEPAHGRGQTQATAMRSLQYDTVSDRYGRHVIEEILPEVRKTYSLRDDAYSRGAAGLSSGGISAFNLAWFHPDHFSRVHSTIGSFTALQRHPERCVEGGYVFPFLVGTEEKRNIRIWMSDGTNDVESTAGSWPLNNIALANSLKLRGYDFHFRFGVAGHNTAQGGLDLPESLAWLWRDYDPGLTTATYEQEASEAAQPVFRVGITNRNAT